MTDVVEQGKSMLGTIEYAKAKGITQAYPDSSVAKVIGNLVAEVERLRQVVDALKVVIEHVDDKGMVPTAYILSAQTALAEVTL
ncbi:hypothetical protein [Mycolicibacterium sp.]|uniref:hypothetical protein n=1 Tax=Mycolicibacterium sp. TaxID=2320850 RepID=UPI0037C63B16